MEQPFRMKEILLFSIGPRRYDFVNSLKREARHLF